MKCPACGNKGNANDGLHFDVMGQVDGTPIRKCLNCGAGLSAGSFGKARVIPASLWAKMEAEWSQAFPEPSSGSALGGIGEPGIPDWLAATMPVEEREAQERSWRALKEIDAYRSTFPPEIEAMHRAYAASLTPQGGNGQWSEAELDALAQALCGWGYATRLWEENRFPEQAPAHIPEAATIVGQSRRAANVPDGAEVAEASASLADGMGEDPNELMAVMPGINRDMRENLCWETARSVIDAAMKRTRYLAPPSQFDFDLQTRCWRFGFFSRCCEASAD